MQGGVRKESWMCLRLEVYCVFHCLKYCWGYMSISVKEAVATAIQEVKDLFSDQQIMSVLLEEVDRNSNENYLITIGFDRPSRGKNLSSALLGISNSEMRERVYKVVCVDKHTSEVLSIKDRVLEKK